jgi:LacI family transcriptional regulator
VAAAVDHLVARGRRRPVMIDCSESCDRVVRRASFLASTARHGLDVGEDRVAMAEQTVAAGAAAAAELLDRHPDADALFGFNDLVAIGALRALRAREVRVPEDCAVVGFDGLTVGELVTPALTSRAAEHPTSRRVGRRPGARAARRPRERRARHAELRARRPRFLLIGISG